MAEFIVDSVLRQYRDHSAMYHTRKHIEDSIELMLNLSPTFRKAYPDLDFQDLLLTILYHDIYYFPGFSDNEARSAEIYRADIRHYGLSAKKEISDAILSTKPSNQEYTTPLQKAMHDIDWFGFVDEKTMVHNESLILAEQVLLVDSMKARDDLVREGIAFYDIISKRPQILVTPGLEAENKQALLNIKKRAKFMKGLYNDEAD